jgi:3-methyl-2-oxobutanoate hydroxymethyltransferase
VITAYDYTLARILDRAGVDVILVGDSLGSVIQGEATTIPVTLDQMTYHCRCVSRGTEFALVVGDMPFLSYQTSPERAIESAGRLMKEGGVAAVKLEGGIHIAPTIERMVQMDIPVMGHVGLTPQSYHRMGGYKMQGTNGDGVGSRARVIEDARAVQAAGAFAVVLECIPAELARDITAQLHIPTIGIGAGPDCDGQVLVCADMFGFQERVPSFAKRYAEVGRTIEEAAKTYIDEVRTGAFPGATGQVRRDDSKLKLV